MEDAKWCFKACFKAEEIRTTHMGTPEQCSKACGRVAETPEAEERETTDMGTTEQCFKACGRVAETPEAGERGATDIGTTELCFKACCSRWCGPGGAKIR